MSICPTNGAITSISNPFFPTTPSNIPTPITLTLHFIAIIPTVFTSVGQTCKCISGSLLRKLTKNMKKKHILFQFAEISSEKCVWDWALFKKLNWWILPKRLFVRHKKRIDSQYWAMCFQQNQHSSKFHSGTHNLCLCKHL